MQVHCFAAYPPGLEPLTMARTSASNPNKAWKPADARCRTRASQMRDARFDHERDRNGRGTSDEITSH